MYSIRDGAAAGADEDRCASAIQEQYLIRKIVEKKQHRKKKEKAERFLFRM